jgi:hypothetical protein
MSQPPQPNIPPGYYRGSQGVMRWSSGRDWTPYVQPPQQLPPLRPSHQSRSQIAVCGCGDCPPVVIPDTYSPAKTHWV